MKKKILIADDNLVILRALSVKLRAAGYEVCLAADGGEVVNIVRTQNPDLILLDLTFPPDVAHGGSVPWDGFLIMDWLHRLEGVREVPIIFITGADPAKYRERALKAGVVNFLTKPLDPVQVLAAIRQALGESPEAPSEAPTSSTAAV